LVDSHAPNHVNAPPTKAPKNTHLKSAVAAVEYFVIYGDWSDLFDIAAAYAFSICEAHAFLDGNKRTALGACLGARIER
jgi:prophage maintenance system killer protein